MRWRERSLAVRTLALVVIVFGPIGLTLAVGMLGLALPEAVGKTLLMGSGGWMCCSFMLVAELFSSSPNSPGSSDADDSGGTDPPGPPTPPTPGGGIPLPDAEQARERVRDHNRPARVRLRGRTREPERTPAPTLPD
jgi:hypothetical protein